MLTCKEDKVEEAKFNFDQIYRDAVDLTWDDEIEMDEEPAQVSGDSKEQSVFLFQGTNANTDIFIYLQEIIPELEE